jgi:hypothetical protein
MYSPKENFVYMSKYISLQPILYTKIRVLVLLGLVQMQHVLLSLSQLNQLQLLLALMLRNLLGKILLNLLVRMPVYKILLPLSLLGHMLPSLLLYLSLLWVLLRASVNSFSWSSIHF